MNSDRLRSHVHTKMRRRDGVLSSSLVVDLVKKKIPASTHVPVNHVMYRQPTTQCTGQNLSVFLP
jgi:hypothetical protein